MASTYACPPLKPLLLSKSICRDDVSLAWDVIRNSREIGLSAPCHYAYASAEKRLWRSECCHREPKQDLKIQAGDDMRTDESSVYGMDKGGLVPDVNGSDAGEH